MGACCTSDTSAPDRLLRNVDQRNPGWNGYIQVHDNEPHDDDDEKLPQLTAINLSIAMCDSLSNTKIKLKLCVGSMIEIYSSFQQKYVQGIIKEIKGDLICIAYGKQIKWLKKDSHHLIEGQLNNQTGANHDIKHFLASAPPQQQHFDNNHLIPSSFQPPPPSNPPPREVLRAHRLTPSTLCAPAQDENDYIVTFKSCVLGLALYPNKNGMDCIVGKCVNKFSKTNVEQSSIIIAVNGEWVAGKQYDAIKNIIKNALKSPPLKIKFRKKIKSEEKRKKYVNESKKEKEKKVFVERGKGFLKIRIEDAAELKHYGSYCVVKLNGAALSTKKVESNEFPEWNEVLTFKNYTPEAGKEAIISVYGSKVIKDKKIGSAKLLIPTIFNELQSDALELHTSNGKLSGVLMVKTIITKNK